MVSDNVEAADGRDIIDETPSYTLSGTDEGWEVWDRNSQSERPVVVFPPTLDGFELAAGYFKRANSAVKIRRGPWLDALRRIAFVAGGVWVATVVVDSVWFAFAENGFSSDTNRWLAALNSISYSFFLAALGVYVVLWLRGHLRP